MGSVKRTPVKYRPVFPGVIEGYVMNCLRKDLWKISATHEHADAIQEAYLVFLRVKAAYPDVQTGSHFLALFKSAWYNHFTTLAAKASVARIPISECSFGFEDGNFFDTLPGDPLDTGFLGTMFRQAPSEVKSVLYLIMNAPTELLEIATASWKNKGHTEASQNRMMCQLLGIEESTDVVGAVKQYFSVKP